MKDLIKDSSIKTFCGQRFNLLGLEEVTGISQSYLSLIMNGLRHPPKGTLEKIAEAFGVDVEKVKSELEKQHGA